jgi:hypothetical protein
MQIQRGLGSSKLAISSVGGTVNIVMKAAEKQQGGSVRFLSGNDSYFKTTAEYNTGVNDKGWAFSFLVDHWQAHRSWARGTFGQGQNYFFPWVINQMKNITLTSWSPVLRNITVSVGLKV